MTSTLELKKATQIVFRVVGAEEHRLLLQGKKHFPSANLQRKEHLSCQPKRTRLWSDV
jgi:hypothetical protein